MRSCFSQLQMLACVIPNVSASCETFVPDRELYDLPADLG